ncbi:MAG: hypothetical protein ACP5P1_10815 [Acidimicrobiales bacterium]
MTSDAIAAVVLLSLGVEVRRRIGALRVVAEVVVTIAVRIRAQFLGEVVVRVRTRVEETEVPVIRPWDEPAKGGVRMVATLTSRDLLDTSARLTAHRARGCRLVLMVRVAAA